MKTNLLTQIVIPVVVVVSPIGLMEYGLMERNAIKKRTKDFKTLYNAIERLAECKVLFLLYFILLEKLHFCLFQMAAIVRDNNVIKKNTRIKIPKFEANDIGPGHLVVNG